MRWKATRTGGADPALERRRARRMRRSVGVVLTLAAVASAAARGMRRWAAVQDVPPELRAGWLYLPVFVPPIFPYAGVNRAAAALARRMMRRRSEPLPEVAVQQLLVADPADPSGRRIEMYVYRPPHIGSPCAALLWIHGGAFVAGHPEQDHDLCSEIAVRARITVVSVDYRLAPAHPFPAALQDCWSTLRWMHDEADSLGIDPQRIAVGGASAGGGLAAALAQRARDEDLPVQHQVLVYPMLDDRSALRSVNSHRAQLALTPALNRYSWASYLGRRPCTASPEPYAAAARRDDLRGLAPAWIGVGDLDPLLEDAVIYSARLRDAGVPCVLHIEPGMYHGADAGLAASVASMRRFRERLCAAVTSGLARTQS